MQTRSSFVVLRTARRPSLHLIHPAAGDSQSYGALVQALPPHWTITASEGRGEASTVREMAQAYLADLRCQADLPDAVGGWSLGGLVGFEVISQLRDDGLSRLPSLFLIDSPPPGGLGAVWAADDPLAEFSEFLWKALEIPGHAPPAAEPGQDAALRALAAAMRGEGCAVDPGWMAEQLTEYRRHRAAVAGYCRTEPVDVPALLVAADLPDSQVTAWRAMLPTSLLVTRLASNHFDLLRPPHLGSVASLLVELLGRPERPGGGHQ